MIKVIKRNGKEVDFQKNLIKRAIENAMIETSKGIDSNVSDMIANNIEQKIYMDINQPTLENNSIENKDGISVEDIQDMVELELMKERPEVAKKYILYRQERTKARFLGRIRQYKYLEEDFLKNYKHMADPFPFELGKFVYYRTYSRPIPEEQRRERWYETVARVVDFNTDLEYQAMIRQGIPVTEREMERLKNQAMEIYDLMFHLKLFPSGRSLWIGGTIASKESPISNFNCSFVTIDNFRKFSEIFHVLLLGTGVGLSVERKYVSKLPKVNSHLQVIHKDYDPVQMYKRQEHTTTTQPSSDMICIIVGDSKSGWEEALEIYFDILSKKRYSDISQVLINYDNVRPKGERLKRFGGFASGHESIKIMFDKMNAITNVSKGYIKLRPIDCLDIATIIAENVISGGVRRSAEIVFCDSDEQEVLDAKKDLYTQDENGNWTANTKILNRSLANNTVFYYEKPTMEQLKNQFQLIRYSGEPSFGNMQEMKRRRKDVQGGNPCFEILLRDRGVCNLSELNLMGFVKEDGSYNKDEILKAHSHVATIGYRVATVELELNEWDIVNSEDRLTGCSLTGVMDFRNATGISDEEFIKLLQDLRNTVHDTTNALADKLRMNRPKLATAIKPSGTVSQLPTVSSGMHYSHSPYYIRRVRITASDPLAEALAENGFTWHPEIGQTIEEHVTKVFEFPVKSPDGRTKYDVSAIEQLELYKMVMQHYVDMNASNTIHVRDNEWEDVANWVYENWDSVVGITFLSLDDNFYQLAPYEAIDEKTYHELMKTTPKLDMNILKKYETFEEFELSEGDCEGGACPVK